MKAEFYLEPSAMAALNVLAQRENRKPDDFEKLPEPPMAGLSALKS